jgi:hypothetical protein
VFSVPWFEPTLSRAPGSVAKHACRHAAVVPFCLAASDMKIKIAAFAFSVCIAKNNEELPASRCCTINETTSRRFFRFDDATAAKHVKEMILELDEGANEPRDWKK